MNKLQLTKKGLVLLCAGNLFMAICFVVARIGISMDISDFVKGFAVALMIGSVFIMKRK
jgi:hypothetical protein